MQYFIWPSWHYKLLFQERCWLFSHCLISLTYVIINYAAQKLKTVLSLTAARELLKLKNGRPPDPPQGVLQFAPLTEWREEALLVC